jgi:hypothetical protein
MVSRFRLYLPFLRAPGYRSLPAGRQVYRGQAKPSGVFYTFAFVVSHNKKGPANGGTFLLLFFLFFFLFNVSW